VTGTRRCAGLDRTSSKDPADSALCTGGFGFPADGVEKCSPVGVERQESDLDFQMTSGGYLGPKFGEIEPFRWAHGPALPVGTFG